MDIGPLSKKALEEVQEVSHSWKCDGKEEFRKEENSRLKYVDKHENGGWRSSVAPRIRKFRYACSFEEMRSDC